MAVLIEGLQGSGKSYYATYKMLHDKDKYHRILTNIDGIKETEQIKQFGFKEFQKNILEEIYKIQVLEDGTFQDCINMLIKLKILPIDVSKDNRILLVIDESQNFFGTAQKNSSVLEWFITQHRHLYIELYLITQKHTLLRPNYKLFNMTYKAYPPSRQFSSKKIKYEEFAGISSSKDNWVRNFTLPKEQKVFDMYVSGDKVDSPNILKTFIIYGILLSLIIGGLITFFLSNFGANTTEQKIKVKEVIRVSTSTKKEEVTREEFIELENLKMFTFRVWDDGLFSIDGVAQNLPIKLLPFLKKYFFREVLDKIEAGQGLTILYVVCDKKIKDFAMEKKEAPQKSLEDFDLKENLI